MKRVFGLSAKETSFARRGFCGSDARAREHLEKVGPAFMSGCDAALEETDLDALAARLNRVPLEMHGFAFEGAAMGLALLDWLTPWQRSRVQAFLLGPGHPHAYMVHVGVGWVLARTPGSVERRLARMEPLLRWLAIDGYGFHEGFFHWPRYIDGQPAPRRLRGYSRRAFDQGFGRSLWFVDGADVESVPRTIARFPAERQPDLWSGVGLAATYAGGIGAAALRALREAAGDCRPQLAQGAAFAAKARQRAGNITGHTEMAAEVLCGLSAPQAAQVTDEALENLPANSLEPAYEIWRCRIQRTFKHRHEMRR
ncbi:MAG: DUF1702 family protein [Verrucomicrobia bacterium]|nr:DUF1702 family protein [Verrucomicrobiota bacterium]